MDEQEINRFLFPLITKNTDTGLIKTYKTRFKDIKAIADLMRNEVFDKHKVAAFSSPTFNRILSVLQEVAIDTGLPQKTIDELVHRMLMRIMADYAPSQASSGVTKLVNQLGITTKTKKAVKRKFYYISFGNVDSVNSIEEINKYVDKLNPLAKIFCMQSCGAYYSGKKTYTRNQFSIIAKFKYENKPNTLPPFSIVTDKGQFIIQKSELFSKLKVGYYPTTLSSYMEFNSIKYLAIALRIAIQYNTEKIKRRIRTNPESKFKNHYVDITFIKSEIEKLEKSNG